MTEITHRRVLRGIPRWLLRGYLEDLGARPASPDADPGVLVAEGWQASLTQLEDYRIGSLSSGQVELVVTGEQDAVNTMLTALEPRLFRGGG
ncbi:MAG: DUF1952 domain-containing protein [Chloroflexota bacterium]